VRRVSKSFVSKSFESSSNLLANALLRLGPEGSGENVVSGSGGKAADRPGGVASHHRIGVLGEGASERRQVRRVPSVPHGNGGIALKSRLLGALHGAVPKGFDVVIPSDCEEGFEVELPSPFREFELRVVYVLEATPVPRANVLADIATKNPVSNQFSGLGG
jgi:hypothetical protein